MSESFPAESFIGIAQRCLQCIAKAWVLHPGERAQRFDAYGGSIGAADKREESVRSGSEIQRSGRLRSGNTNEIGFFAKQFNDARVKRFGGVALGTRADNRPPEPGDPIPA